MQRRRDLKPMRFACVIVAIALLSCESRASTGAVAASPPPEIVRIDGYEANLVPIPQAGGVAVGPDGRIVVAQMQDHAFRVYGADGSLLTTVGRRGGGPGEFQRLLRVGWWGDSIWTWDAALQRAQVFAPGDPRGRLVPLTTGVEIEGQDAFELLSPHGIRPDGAFIASGDNFRISALIHVAADAASRILMVFENREHTARVDDRTILAVDLFPALSPVAASSSGAFAAAAQAEPGGAQSSYEVALFNAAGATVYRRLLPFEPVPVPSAYADSVRAARAARMLPPAKAVFERNAYVPDHFPPLRDLVVEEDGTVWVAVLTDLDTYTYTILDPTGAPTGSASVAGNARIVATGGEAVWVLETDANDVQSLVRYERGALVR